MGLAGEARCHTWSTGPGTVMWRVTSCSMKSKSEPQVCDVVQVAGERGIHPPARGAPGPAGGRRDGEPRSLCAPGDDGYGLFAHEGHSDR